MIYLDNNSTTKPYRNLMGSVAAMCDSAYGNPSSTHSLGRVSRDIINQSREQVAKAVGCKSNEIIFTSGGTEANNIACKSRRYAYGTSIEHASVNNNIHHYKIPLKKNGLIDIKKFKKELESGCYPHDIKNVVMSVMLSNNETGLILDPNHEIKKLKEEFGFIYHVDAVHGFGKDGIVWNPDILGADMMSISGHKIHAMKGIGALYIREESQSTMTSLMNGGGQEFGVRPGTENLAGIYSLGYMCEKISDDPFFRDLSKNIVNLRNRFEHNLSDLIEINGDTKYRAGNTSNISFKAIDDLELFLDQLSENGICASGMSACSSGFSMPSRVLQYLYGNDEHRLNSSVRFSFSIHNTMEEVEVATSIIRNLIESK